MTCTNATGWLALPRCQATLDNNMLHHEASREQCTAECSTGSPTGVVSGTASLPLSAPAARRAPQRPAQPLAALVACRLRVFALLMQVKEFQGAVLKGQCR